MFAKSKNGLVFLFLCLGTLSKNVTIYKIYYCLDTIDDLRVQGYLYTSAFDDEEVATRTYDLAVLKYWLLALTLIFM